LDAGVATTIGVVGVAFQRSFFPDLTHKKLKLVDEID
jgi:hypothetical protein